MVKYGLFLAHETRGNLFLESRWPSMQKSMVWSLICLLERKPKFLTIQQANISVWSMHVFSTVIQNKQYLWKLNAIHFVQRMWVIRTNVSIQDTFAVFTNKLLWTSFHPKDKNNQNLKIFIWRVYFMFCDH